MMFSEWVERSFFFFAQVARMRSPSSLSPPLHLFLFFSTKMHPYILFLFSETAKRRRRRSSKGNIEEQRDDHHPEITTEGERKRERTRRRRKEFESRERIWEKEKKTNTRASNRKRIESLAHSSSFTRTIFISRTIFLRVFLPATLFYAGVKNFRVASYYDESVVCSCVPSPASSAKSLILLSLSL